MSIGLSREQHVQKGKTDTDPGAITVPSMAMRNNCYDCQTATSLSQVT
jgi:hypothetical protein